MNVLGFFGGMQCCLLYLINQMPSTMLNCQSFSSILFPHTPLFSLTPPVLGCFCVANILDDSRQDKLDPKAIVFFLGTHILRTVINVRTLSLVTVLCLLMLPSLRVHRSFHLKVDH